MTYTQIAFTRYFVACIKFICKEDNGFYCPADDSVITIWPRPQWVNDEKFREKFPFDKITIDEKRRVHIPPHDNEWDLQKCPELITVIWNSIKNRSQLLDMYFLIENFVPDKENEFVWEWLRDNRALNVISDHFTSYQSERGLNVIYNPSPRLINKLLWEIKSGNYNYVIKRYTDNVPPFGVEYIIEA